MVQKYVWWDDVHKHEFCRVDLRMPKPLRDFVREVAKVHGVTSNAFIVGVLAYAADSNAHKRLRIEVIPGVRVTEAKPGAEPVEIPVPVASLSAAKRWTPP